MPERPKSRISEVLLHMAALLIAGMVLFYPVLRNQFVFNDVEGVVLNNALRDPDFVRFLFSPQHAALYSAPDYFSPIASLSYALDIRMQSKLGTNALSPTGMHAVNLALYLAVVLLAYACFLVITARPRLSALAAALFLVHPMHSENVNYVSSRPELLGAFFVLVALLLSWLNTRALGARIAQCVAVAFAALFAMLSDEVGLAAPLLLLAADWARFRRKGGAPQGAWKARMIPGYLPLACAFALFIVLRLALFGSLLSASAIHPFFQNASASARLWAPVQALVRYIALALFPYPQTLIYNPLEAGARAFWFNGPVSLAIAAAVACAAALLSRRIAWVGLGGLLFLAGILPALPFVPSTNVISESALLIPAAGACLLIAGVLAALLDRKLPLLEGTRNTMVMAGCALLLAVLASLSYARGMDWKTARSLWSAEYRLHPRDEIVLASLAFDHSAAGEYQEAETYYEKAKKNYATRPMIFYEMAANYMRLDDAKKAVAVLDEGIAKVKSPSSDFYLRMGESYEVLRQFEKAQNVYQKSLDADPKSWLARVQVGRMMQIRHQYDKALEQYDIALKNAPPSEEEGIGEIHLYRCMALRDLKKTDEAVAAGGQAVRWAPFEPGSYLALHEAWLDKMSEPALEKLSSDEMMKKRQEYWGRAVNAILDGIHTAPDRRLYWAMANLYQLVEETKQAVYWLDQCVGKYPNDRATLLYAATLLIEANEFDRAAKIYLKLMEDPVYKNNPHVRAGLGYCLFQKGKYEEARKFCEEALNIRKGEPMALLLYRSLSERGYQVGVDLSDIPPNLILNPGSIVQRPEEQPEIPIELQATPRTARGK